MTVLDASGARRDVQQFDGEVSVVQLAGRQLVVQHGRTLEVRGGGSAVTASTLPGVRLVGAGGSTVLTLDGDRLNRSELDLGATRLVARARLGRIDGTRIVSAAARRVGVHA